MNLLLQRMKGVCVEVGDNGAKLDMLLDIFWF